MEGSPRRHRRREELEPPQAEAVSARGNLVVAAGAGSGKTTVLAARYVRLLSEGRMKDGSRVHARNVLVLSFTRKAAAEMRTRIYGALLEALAGARAGEAAGESDSPGAGEGTGEAADRDGGAGEGLSAHLADCVEGFSQAQISTFDSFAARIARSGAARWGIAPDFAVDDERLARLASELAQAFLLERRADAAVRALVEANGFVGARDRVLAALALRMSLSSPADFRACHEVQAARLEESLREARARILDLRAAALERALERALEPALGRTATERPGGTTKTAAAWMAAFAAEPGGSGSRREAALPETAGPVDEEAMLRFLAGFDSLTKPASSSKDEVALYLSEAVPPFREAAARYRALAAARAAHPGRLALYLLLDDFRIRWERARRVEKLLCFRDVARLALDSLREDRELRAWYKRLFRFVMIDEFQDDDEIQKRVLYLIAERAEAEAAGEPGPEELEPDKLFFVGDEKQSIYLFRGADLRVFRSLAGELDRAPGRRAEGSLLCLSRNFRSEPGLIDAINAVFPSVMAPAPTGAASGAPTGAARGEEEGAPFEARFEPLGSRAATPGVEPLVVYLELPYRAEVPGLRPRAECEAWEIARLIRDAVEGESLMVADRRAGIARPARYEDFAILLRSTGNQVHFEKYLRLHKVPYGSENACGLFSEAVACDLYYALRLAAFPEDRNALAAYLRSPFAGLSDEGAARILLDDALRDTLSPADAAASERGVRTQAELAALVDRESLTRCLSFLWYEAGYRTALLRDPVASGFEEHFELVHSLAAAADARGDRLAAFVAELEAYVGSPEKLDIELPRERSRGVRIMTIHKSKGLEFPVVILPQANNVGREGEGGEAWYWDEELGPTFRLPEEEDDPKRRSNIFYEEAKAERIAMGRAEQKRLLYVAMTRAESHLIVSSTAPRSTDRARRSFRSLLGEPLGLFAPPSPLVPQEAIAPRDAIVPGTGAEGNAAGPRLRLPSGALVGLIPERSDLDYFALTRGARAGRGQAWAEIRALAAAIPLVVRGCGSRSITMSGLDPSPEAAPAADALRLEAPADRRRPEGFPPELWGSLVHAILERRASGGAPWSGPAPSLEAAIVKAWPLAKARTALYAAAGRLADGFAESELGRRALASSERLAEWPVALALEIEGRRLVARGTVDLLFREEGRAVIIDYKTDERIEAGRHEAQVSAYARAASAILGLPVEAWVFYLCGPLAIRAAEAERSP